MDQIPMKNQVTTRMKSSQNRPRTGVGGAPKSTQKQSGSVLIIIFVMIALFAAFSYVMSLGMRSGSASLTKEQTKLAAVEIMEYSTAVRNAIKMMVANGTPIEKICTVRQFATTDAGTPLLFSNAACTDDSCRVFKPTGGAVKERYFYDYAQKEAWWNGAWTKAGSSDFIIARFEGVGTSLSDIAMRTVQIKPEICTAINVMMGLGTAPINQDGDGGTFYDLTGNVTASLAQTNMYIYGVTEPRVKGIKTFCTSVDRAVIAVVYAR